MLEAKNKDEAIISILDVMKENPLWTNKVNSSLYAILKALNPDEQEFLLSKQIDEQVIDLFVEMKTQQYNFKENFYKQIEESTPWKK